MLITLKLTACSGGRNAFYTLGFEALLRGWSIVVTYGMLFSASWRVTEHHILGPVADSARHVTHLLSFPLISGTLISHALYVGSDTGARCWSKKPCIDLDTASDRVSETR